ncbi:MAG: ROK family protein [Bacilli bacterium]
MSYAVGVDIGGTKINAGVVSEHGEVLVTVQKHTPVDGGAAAILHSCLQAVEEVRNSVNVDLAGLGIATAGRIDENGVVTFSTKTLGDWAGTPVREWMQRETGLRTVVENDANAAALAEALVGASLGYASTFLIALGTGVGGGWVDGGRVVHGASGGAGEIGHILYVRSGRSCPCGYQGCFEPYVSVRALALEYSARMGRPCDGRDVMAAFSRGEAGASDVVRNWLIGISALIFSVQNAYDPHCIVIGGGIVDDSGIWWHVLQDEVMRLPLHALILPAQLKSQAAMIGAARLVWCGTGPVEMGR